MTDQGEEQPGEAPRFSEDKLEAADALRSNSIGWIANADAKATTIASVLAVVLGLVSIDMAEASRAASLEVVYWIFLGLSAVSVALCVATLWPVTNRKAYVSDSLAASPTFFGDVPESFATYAARSVSEDDLRVDRVEQAFTVARIARRKMSLVRWTIVSFVLTMLTLIAVAFMASFGHAEASQASTSTGRSAVEADQRD